MLNIEWIRAKPNELDQALQRRGMPPQSDVVLKIDSARRACMTEQQQLLAQRNKLSQQVGELKTKGLDASALMAEVKELAPRLAALSQQEEELAAQLQDLLARLPNVPFEDVPFGEDERGNVEVQRWGEPQQFGFPVQAHDDLAAKLGLLDNDAASKIAGARFVWLQGDLARLERAIAQFFLDFLTARGFIEVRVPYLVNSKAMYGTGQLPKFSEDLFKIEGADRWLIPTSEVPLTNYALDTVFTEKDLPVRFTSWSPCFRSEAGSAGRDTKGLIRVHQFDKVEMVQLVHPEESEKAHQFMVTNAQDILKALELPHRTVLLCTGDMGFGSRKTYDLEVWVPSQNCYREISSCSNCGDFQARRMNAKFKPAAGGPTEFIHTLNGSGLAVGRTLVAILENYQTADGDVLIPAVLQSYMGGLKSLRSR